MKRALLFLLALLPTLAFAAPPAATPYHHQLVREALYVWGLDAPIAVFGAQIQQESGWNPKAHSSVAAGLSEFTPQTAEWIAGAYKDQLGDADPYDPAWAIRALVIYDYDLWGKTSGVDDCNHMAFVLSAYNGGLGWVYQDQAIAAEKGYPKRRWFGSVERFSRRSAAAMKENRGYPHRILLVLQPDYLDWGSGVDCTGDVTWHLSASTS